LSEERVVRVKVDGAEKLEELKEKHKATEEKYQKEINEYKKKLEDAEAKSGEAEKYKKTLEELAQKEYEEKKEATLSTLEERRAVLGDEKVDELKEMIDEGGPEKLDRVMYWTDSLAEALIIAKEQVEKELKDAGLTREDIEKGKESQKKQKKKVSKGSISLLPALRKRGEGDIWSREYDDKNPAEFVNDLYTAIRTETDPVKKEKLEEARDNLWRLLWEGEVKSYRRSGRSGIEFPREYILDPEARKILKRKGKL